MPYDPYLWKDSKAGGTPITAARLNAIEQGVDRVADVADAASVQAAAASTSLDSIRGQVTDLASRVTAANARAVGVVALDANLNTYKTPGDYRVGDGGGWRSAVNFPPGSYGFGLLSITVAGNSITQSYVPDGGDITYVRSSWNVDDWHPWNVYSNDLITNQNLTNAFNSYRQIRQFNVMDFGAKGDGVTDDRVAIQAAIDQARNTYNGTGAIQEVYFPGRIFIVSATGFYKPDGGQYGVCSLLLHTGVRLVGSGTVKCANSSRGAGTLYAVIKSDAAGIHDAGIDGLRIDGNRANNVGSDQCSNIVLNVDYSVTINNVTSYEADGEGIQVIGPFNGGQARGVKITNCRVSNCDRIGIQVSHFDDLLISGNSVAYCGNNCIDIYGDINGQSYPDGNNFIISNNVCASGLSGIFPETVANGIVSNNRCYNMSESGIHVNRSWSTVDKILIEGNTLSNVQFGMLFTGDMSSVVVRGNWIYAANQAGIKLGQDGYRASNITVLDNVIQTNNANATPLVLFTGPQVAYCRVRGTITNNTDRGWDNVFYNLSANVGNTVSSANAA